MVVRAFWIFAVAIVVGAAAVLSAWWFLPLAKEEALRDDWEAYVRVLAGNGVSAVRDGDVTVANFADPFGLAVAADHTIYVADGVAAHRIRRVSPDGQVSTVAGGARGFADGSSTTARFDTPSGVAVHTDGALYVADTGNNAVRRVTGDGAVVTLAGDGVPGWRDGRGSEARFNGPIGVAVDAAGRVIVADTYNDRIRTIDTDGIVRTLAGGPEPGFLDGPNADARFDTPTGLAVDATGVIYVADTGNHAIRRIWPDGVVTTVSLVDHGVLRPLAIAVDTRGMVYVADDSARVVEVTPSGVTRVIAGGRSGFADGPGVEARFRHPAGIVSLGPGHLVVADAGNALLRTVAAPARAPLRPPPSPLIAPRFDAQGFGIVPLLWPVAPLHGPFEVAGTLGEARGESAGRFHAGIDIRVEAGTPVLAVRDGAVASPVSTGEFGTLNEWLRVGPVTYVHMRTGRTLAGQLIDTDRFVAAYDDRGRIARVRVKRGAHFRTGDVIGSVNGFNHVHVNIGWPGHEYNPLLFRLVQFEDTVAPTIAPNGVRLFSDDGTPLAHRVRGRLLVSGRVQVVVDAWDQADGNRPGRRLGLYELGYQILGADGLPVPDFEDRRTTIRFDQIRADVDATRLVFAPGSGIPFYGKRVTRFLYVVTNTYRDGVATQDFWDTTHLPPGDYTLRVRAADFHGNEAIARRDVLVTVVAAE